MDRFKKLEEKTGIPAIVWQSLAESAKMEGEMTGTTITEPILNDHHELEGMPIGVAEAGRKYGIDLSTIAKWAKRDLIKVLRRPEHTARGKQVLLDEASVALAADLYRQNPGQGRNPLKLLKNRNSS